MQKRRLDIYTPEDQFYRLGKYYKIVLEGPIEHVPDWQFSVPEIPGVVWLSPRRRSYSTNYDDETHIHNVAIERKIADLVLVWIPDSIDKVPKPSYALETKIIIDETLRTLKKGVKDVIIGCHEDFIGKRYLKNKLKYPILNSLEECIEKIPKIPKTRESRIFLTSDTNFDSLDWRFLRNANDRHWKIIENWNSKVKPWDIVYHLGNFGYSWPINFLNGEIHLFPSRKDLNDYYSVFPLEIIIEDESKMKPWWNKLNINIDKFGYCPILEDNAKFYLDYL